MQRDILEKLQALPGVTWAAFANSLPMEGFGNNDPIFAEDKPYAQGQTPPVRRFKYISPGLFQTMGTRMIAGRDMTWNDIDMRRPVALVSENLAREWWGEPAAALGKRIQDPSHGPWREIVGVVQDVHDNGLTQASPTIVYWPVLMENFFQNRLNVTRSVVFAIRTDRAGTAALINEIRQSVWSTNPNLPLAFVRTQQDNYDRSLAGTSFALVMLGIAGLMAMLLAIIGIYGVTSYVVTQRTREIGIRMALGAHGRDVQRMFVRQVLVLSAAGLAIGLAAAVALTRLMSSLLFETSTLDATTYAAVCLILVAGSMMATYLPARRAVAINPVDALKDRL
jgi:predicted permease